MPTGRLEWTLFVAGVVALSALVIGIAWQQRTRVNRPTARASERAEPITAAAETSAKEPSTKTAVAGAAKGAAVAKAETAASGRKKQKTAANPARRKGGRATPPPRPFFTFSAARGDSWLSIRVGSSAGKVLYEGLLQKGRTLRYRASTLWVRLGAATYVDVRVGKRKKFDLPFGTADVLLDRSGKSQLVSLG
jgi:hypothetical protein